MMMKNRGLILWWILFQATGTCRALLVVAPSSLTKNGLLSQRIRGQGEFQGGPCRRPFMDTTRQLWIFGNEQNKDTSMEGEDDDDDDDDDDDMYSLDKFQKAKDAKRKSDDVNKIPDDFDGYRFRDIILQKWGRCYDVDFNKVDTLGFRSLYLNVMPFHLGKRPFRHETELDYLCHLQAVVEILQQYDQLDYVLQQIQETKKKPRPGTSPLVAVPLRLDLTPDQVKQILDYR